MSVSHSKVLKLDGSVLEFSTQLGQFYNEPNLATLDFRVPKWQNFPRWYGNLAKTSATRVAG